MNLFLDTTILIDKTFGTSNVKERINSTLSGNRITVSSFAIGELKGNILQQCCNLYDMLSETTNIFEAILKCSKNIRKPSWYNRMVKICMYLGDAEIYTDTDLENYKDNLEILIDNFNSRVLSYIDEILYEGNCVNCLKANAEPDKNEDTDKWNFDINPICKCQETVNCNLHSFLINNNRQLIKIKSANKTLVKTQKTNMGKLLALKTIHGQNCWNCGDSILCAELPENYYMYSTDTVIKNICSLLDKKSIL